VVVGAGSIGLIGPAVRTLPGQVSPISVAAVRMAVGALGFLAVAVLGWTGRATRGRRCARTAAASMRPVRGWLVAAAIGNALTYLTFFTALQCAGVIITMVLQVGLDPVATAVLERLVGVVGGITTRWVVATVLAVTGCLVLLVDGQVVAGPRWSVGVAAAVVSSLAYATFSVCSSQAIRAGCRASLAMTASFTGAAVILAPALLFVPGGWVWTLRGGTVALFLGLGATTAAYLLIGRGFRRLTAATVATLNLTESVTATTAAVVILHEHLTGPGALGVAAIVTAILVLALRRHVGPAPAPALPRNTDAARAFGSVVSSADVGRTAGVVAHRRGPLDLAAGRPERMEGP
jgi:DME family drug/metabolite transporter